MKMKKILILTILIFCVGKINAQQFQNPSFDSVYFGGIDRIWFWVPGDATLNLSPNTGDTVQPHQSNQLFSFMGEHMLFGQMVDVYQPTPYSNVCIKLPTRSYKKMDGSPYETFIVNGDHFYTGNDGYIDFSKSGEPFTYRPDSLTGYYQYIDSNTANTDYGHCTLLLSRYNSSLNKRDTIAYLQDSLNFSVGQWKRFSIPIKYLSGATPDTMTTIFRASTRPSEGASFWLDELKFVYGPNSTVDLLSSKKLPIIYPNPSQGTINIIENGIHLTRYQIININGSIVVEGKLPNIIEIPKSLKGMNYINLFNKKGLVNTQKIILQ